MKVIYESEKYPVKNENEEIEGYERVIIYLFDNIEESEDFDILSNKEKLLELGLKEDNTPNTEHVTGLKRYFIDNSDTMIVVKETTIIY